MKRLTATLCLTIAVLLGSAGMSVSGDWEKGYAAYKGGDYATALREWEPLAIQGDADAQTNLGVMYHRGDGVPQNDKTAVKWWKLAAEQGHADAQYKLGLLHEIGLGVPPDKKTAVKWCRRAAKQGHADAQTYLGNAYSDGKGVPKNDKTALKWYRLAARQGNADARKNIEKIKSRLVTKGITDCLNDEIKKVTGPETKKIVEKQCRKRMDKKSLDWLLQKYN